MNSSWSAPSEKTATLLITIVSIVVPVLVAALMYFPSNVLQLDLNFPLFHAWINGITAVLLGVGFYFIMQRMIAYHRMAMISAFSLSVLFLVSYVLSKLSHPPTPFGGEGWIRPFYFAILISHIVLAAVIVPMALFTIYRSWTGDFQKHKKIARWTFPIWMYVAVTGVLVYILMSPYY